MQTREGTALVKPGEWIVTYEDGTTEVFDPADFHQRFEPVPDPEEAGR